MLLTKLHIPSPGKNLVHRPILFNKLNEGLHAKLMLISAPAGFGKTSLLSDWLRQQKISAAWFSLDKSDNDPAVFLSYIITGIQGIDPNFGRNALALINSPDEANFESLVSLLINDILNIQNDFLLILDDYHLIHNPDISGLLAFFLEHLPAHCHLVILTRSDPVLPLARLRSQNQLLELRSAELSFTAADISTLFNKKLRLGLSVDDVFSLAKKTEGWIAGLQLAALSMQGQKNIAAFIKAFAGNNRYIMDYLIEEVLKLQSDEVKSFLLKTSVLKQFSAPLCNAILSTDNSQEIIEMLEKENMFVVPLDEERQWYRYHHLFADLLKQRFLQHRKSEIETLHHKACEWFEQNKFYDLAIEHALAANNFKKSIAILGEIVEEMWKSGQHSAILKYGNEIPEALIKENPEFCLYYSWILIMAGQTQKAEPFLNSANTFVLRKIAEQPGQAEKLSSLKKLLGKIAVAFAYMYSHDENPEKIFDHCEIAMKNLDEEDPLWYSWVWFSYGIAHFSRGDLSESNKAYEKALEYGKKSANIYLISTIVIRLAESEQQLGHYKSAYARCKDLLSFLNQKGYAQLTHTEWTYASLYFVMGVSHFTWAEMDEAFENIKIANRLCENGKDVYLRIFVLMFYSFLLNMYNDSEAESKILELENLMNQHKIPPFITSMYIGWKIYLSIKTNQLSQAEHTIATYGLALDKEKTHANEPAYLAYVRLLLIQNRWQQAEILLGEIYVLAKAGQRIERLIEVKISYAFLHKLKGDRKEAIADVLDAMELASEENLISYFLFNADHTFDLLEDAYKIQATQKTKVPDSFIKKLKKALQNSERREKSAAATDLSTRELDTLKLIIQDMSNQEIANNLFISLNTVKTHLKNIYLKLEVDNRKNAVARAHELGLF